MAHLPTQYPNRSFFGLLSQKATSMLLVLHRLLSPFQGKTVFLGFGGLHILVPSKMIMTSLTESLLMMVFSVQNHSYKVKHSLIKFHILRGTCLATNQE